MINDKQPSALIQIENMSKSYQMGDIEVQALREVSLAVAPGEYVAIMGTSGSGKSTLMNMIGLLDRPTRGSNQQPLFPAETLAGITLQYNGADEQMLSWE